MDSVGSVTFGAPSGARYLRRHGLLVAPSTGSVLAAVMRLTRDIEPGATVVALSPDMGDQYIETLYDDEWIDGKFPKLRKTETVASVTES